MSKQAGRRTHYSKSADGLPVQDSVAPHVLYAVQADYELDNRMTAKEIAKKHKVSESFILKMKKKHNWKRASKKIPKVVKETVQLVETSAQKELVSQLVGADELSELNAYEREAVIFQAVHDMKLAKALNAAEISIAMKARDTADAIDPESELSPSRLKDLSQTTKNLRGKVDTAVQVNVGSHEDILDQLV